MRACGESSICELRKDPRKARQSAEGIGSGRKIAKVVNGAAPSAATAYESESFPRGGCGLCRRALVAGTAARTFRFGEDRGDQSMRRAWCYETRRGFSQISCNVISAAKKRLIPRGPELQRQHGRFIFCAIDASDEIYWRGITMPLPTSVRMTRA